MLPVPTRPLHAIPAECATSDRCRRVFDHVPTVVVNNAEWTYSNKPSLDVTDAEFDRVVDINLKSVFLATQAVLPALIEAQTGGSSVNVSSTGAIRPRPGLVW
ncbi:uncharacterized protein PFL1_05271 [Pseudozyma flocculosa PF-1]|uniref:Uncharacterized protein n=1 Tax=Pseudozyma flocculosa PF-1 TaxID=1277687 RepID=A0A061H5S2_9BASI|nr:uncharacterized protein PFL1_05271 [Pseudozyma flocculosa PF-1]EPQ27350.1 hypothetical protein PFL1_05271 [Pseudozyma flocculosa PF-1]